MPIFSGSYAAASIKMAEWINARDYEFSVEISDGKSFVMDNFTGSFTGCLAKEIDRWASASLESVVWGGASKMSEKSIGWDLIKGYYVAYFAGHAIMRICGRAVSNLQQGECDSIRQVHNLFIGKQPNLGRGDYCIQNIAGGSEISLTHNSSAKGGAHFFFWRQFDQLLGDILSSPVSAVAAYQADLLKIAHLREVLSRGSSSGGIWMSRFRNEVNYKLEHAAWHPYDGGKTKLQCQNIRALLSSFSTDSSEITLVNQPDDPVQSFASVIRFLVSLMLELLADISRRYGDKLIGNAFRYKQIQKLIDV